MNVIVHQQVPMESTVRFISHSFHWKKKEIIYFLCGFVCLSRSLPGWQSNTRLMNSNKEEKIILFSSEFSTNRTRYDRDIVSRSVSVFQSNGKLFLVILWENHKAIFSFFSFCVQSGLGSMRTKYLYNNKCWKSWYDFLCIFQLNENN